MDFRTRIPRDLCHASYFSRLAVISFTKNSYLWRYCFLRAILQWQNNRSNVSALTWRSRHLIFHSSSHKPTRITQTSSPGTFPQALSKDSPPSTHTHTIIPSPRAVEDAHSHNGRNRSVEKHKIWVTQLCKCKTHRLQNIAAMQNHPPWSGWVGLSGSNRIRFLLLHFAFGFEGGFPIW